MPPLVQDLCVRVGQKPCRGAAQARVQLDGVERRLRKRAEAGIAPSRTVRQTPAQRTAAKILVDAGRGEAVEARDGALEAVSVDAELACKLRDCVGASDRGRDRSPDR